MSNLIPYHQKEQSWTRKEREIYENFSLAVSICFILTIITVGMMIVIPTGIFVLIGITFLIFLFITYSDSRFKFEESMNELNKDRKQYEKIIKNSIKVYIPDSKSRRYIISQVRSIENIYDLSHAYDRDRDRDPLPYDDLRYYSAGFGFENEEDLIAFKLMYPNNRIEL